MRLAHPRSRLSVGIVAFVVVWGLTNSLPWDHRLAYAWDAYLVTVLTILGTALLDSEAGDLREIARREDPSRFWVFLFTLASASASLVLVVRLLGSVKEVGGAAGFERAALAVFSVGGSWVLLHTVYAFRYAHHYYSEEVEGQKPPLGFPGDEAPDAFDFLYFSFCLGMCFQTSDVVITSRPIRRSATVHTLLAFVFNTTVLAVAINGLASLGGK